MRQYTIYVAMTVTNFLMFIAAYMKIIAQEPMALQSFAVLGLPAWFGTFIGLCEFAGAIGIWIRKLSSLAALGLTIILAGALYYHIVHTPLIEGLFALILIVCTLYILVKRWPDRFWA
jgi:putative oxidoreductase